MFIKIIAPFMAAHMLFAPAPQGRSIDGDSKKQSMTTESRTRAAAPARNIDIRAVMSSTVTIYTKDEDGMEKGCGSGFFVSPHVIATNFHVIDGASSGVIKFSGSGREVSIAKVIAVDVEHDLALLYVPGTLTKPLPLASGGNLAIGSTVYVVGSPLGQEGTFSEGIVSSYRNDGLMQMSAPISPGNSGGPVLDDQGAVVGISVASYPQGQNLNLAVPVSHLLALLQRSSK
ncbi:MAG: serine protease [Cyanobacteria bacterium]|nr:serine protease [Cyanobacteriota bacterium]